MKIKTVDLKGKAYAPVGERIKALHEEHQALQERLVRKRALTL